MSADVDSHCVISKMDDMSYANNLERVYKVTD